MRAQFECASVEVASLALHGALNLQHCIFPEALRVRLIM